VSRREPPPDVPVISPSLAGAFVLVVEDKDDARTLLATLLTLYGAQVTAVSSVREAVSCFERVTPDIVVSDIHMPEEDGFDLIRWLRALPPERGGNTPAVAVTAFYAPGDREQILEAGYQEHLAKPVEIENLIVMLARVLGRAR